MAALGLDDEPDMVELDAAGADGAPRRRRATPKKPARPKPSIVTLALPAQLAAPGTDQVRVLSAPPKGRTANAPWLHVGDLAWLVDTLANQVHNGGVDFVPSPSSLRKPFYSERDRAWICRAKTPAGDLLRKTLTIPLFDRDGATSSGPRRPLTSAEFNDMKQSKLQEILNWQEAVEAGIVSE